MTGRLDLLLQSHKCLRLYYSPSLLSLLLRLIKQYCFIFMITDPFHCVPYVQYLRHLYSFISITVIFSSNIFLWLLFICSVSLLRLSFSHCSKYTHYYCLLEFCFVFRLERKNCQNLSCFFYSMKINAIQVNKRETNKMREMHMKEGRGGGLRTEVFL